MPPHRTAVLFAYLSSMRNHRWVVFARIKKRFGVGAAQAVDETAAAKTPLAHDEVTYRAESAPAAKAPLAHDEATYRAKSSPAANAPLAEERGRREVTAVLRRTGR